MTGGHDRLTEVLDGYANFLRAKELALPKHQPYLVRWVKDFLLFAKEHGGYTFEQTLDLFLAEVGGRVGTKPWQLQQASDAIRIYRYQYRGGNIGATLWKWLMVFGLCRYSRSVGVSSGAG